MLYGVIYSVLRVMEEDMNFRSCQENHKKLDASGDTYRMITSQELSSVTLKNFVFLVKEQPTGNNFNTVIDNKSLLEPLCETNFNSSDYTDNIRRYQFSIY